MSIPSWAVRGAKVVYIGTGLPDEPGTEHVANPVIGRVYTINWTGKVGHQFCLGFVELSDEAAWDFRGFRPVITIDDDLKAHFAHLLDVPAEPSVVVAEPALQLVGAPSSISLSSSAPAFRQDGLVFAE